MSVYDVLWFDVVFQYYTTEILQMSVYDVLWFDVVFQYYTTRNCDPRSSL